MLMGLILCQKISVSFCLLLYCKYKLVFLVILIYIELFSKFILKIVAYILGSCVGRTYICITKQAYDKRKNYRSS